MIYVSTGGMKNKLPHLVCKKLFENEIKYIELSGGQYSESTFNELKKLKTQLSMLVHNYFPPPENPFVMNLGSVNNHIQDLTFKHIKRAIKLAHNLGSKYYSFHAGFLIDPNVKELGKKIINRKLNSRKDSLEIFISNVLKLSDYAKKYNVELLIENNVLSHNNFIEFDDNPLLMVEKNECIEVMKSTPNNVNLLIDFAHLKVSANSLGFNPNAFLKDCGEWIKAYHLSDNNGLSDSNSVFNEDAWFWPLMKKDLDYYSIEVYNVQYKVLKNLIELTKNKLYMK